MKQYSGENRRWNLFVRELEDLLGQHGHDLTDLISEAGLHPEKVRRLKQSLALPRFHLLNPEDLQQVSECFSFTGEEHLRLRAAIVATAVEETLMNRIDPENALRAAEEIFPLLVEALRQRFGQQSGLAAIRGSLMSKEPPPTHDLLDPILERFDQGMLALHLSRESLTESECREQALKARDRFTIVIANLDALSIADPEIAQDDVWQMWHQETQKSLTMVEEDLAQLLPDC